MGSSIGGFPTGPPDGVQTAGPSISVALQAALANPATAGSGNWHLAASVLFMRR